jgi:hypothetical protein
VDREDLALRCRSAGTLDPDALADEPRQPLGIAGSLSRKRRGQAEPPDPGLAGVRHGPRLGAGGCGGVFPQELGLAQRERDRAALEDDPEILVGHDELLPSSGRGAGGGLSREDRARSGEDEEGSEPARVHLNSF